MGKLDARLVFFLSFYGFTMVWSPIFGTSEAMVFADLLPFEEELLASRLCSLLGFGASMFVFSCLGERGRRCVERPAFGWVAAALGAVGMLLGALAGVGLLPLSSLYFGALLRGMFATTNAMMWIPLFMRLDWKTMGSSLAGALMLYAVVGITIVALTMNLPAASVILLAACPLLSHVGYLCAALDLKLAPVTAREEAPAPMGTRLMLYAANFLFGVMLGAVVCHFSAMNSMLAMMTFLGMSLILFAAIMLLPPDRGLHFAFRAFMLVASVAIPLVVLSGLLGLTLASMVSSAVLAVVIFYSVTIFSDSQARFSLPFWKVPGRCQSFAAAGMAASFVAFGVLSPGSASASDIMMIALACVMFVAGVFSPTDRAEVRPWGFSSLVPVESPEIRRLRRCGELADEFRLTSRELEILQQLAMGSTKEEIAEMLVISPATAKTHIRNIYAKLGIHSQKDLQQLIEE